MPNLFPWQMNERTFEDLLPTRLFDALEALQQATYDLPRRWSAGKPIWSDDGRKFDLVWRGEQRYQGERKVWSDGTFLGGMQKVWNGAVQNTRRNEARERRDYNYHKPSLPHEFTLKLTLEERRGATALSLRLAEEIDPTRLTRDFEHSAESVDSQIEDALTQVWGPIQSALGNAGETGLIAPPPPRKGVGAHAVDAKGLLTETYERFVATRSLPGCLLSGATPPARAQSGLVPDSGRELAHYATALGDIYDDPVAWRRAHDLVESFTPRGLGRAAFMLDLPDLYGPIKGVKADWLEKNLAYLFEKCGFAARAPGGGAQGLFVCNGSARVPDAPEPYGKWKQLQERRPNWRETLDLEVQARATVSRDLSTGDAKLGVWFSTAAFPALDRLTLAINAMFNVNLSSLGFGPSPPLPSPARRAPAKGKLLPPVKPLPTRRPGVPRP